METVERYVREDFEGPLAELFGEVWGLPPATMKVLADVNTGIVCGKPMTLEEKAYALTAKWRIEGGRLLHYLRKDCADHYRRQLSLRLRLCELLLLLLALVVLSAILLVIR